MNIPTDMTRLKGFRYPREIIAHAVWAYHRLALRQSFWSMLFKLRPSGSTATERQLAHGRGRDHDLWQEALAVTPDRREGILYFCSSNSWLDFKANNINYVKYLL
jgi:hypothetical protein